MKKLASVAVLFLFVSAGALAQPPSETPQPPSAPETAKPEAAPPPAEATFSSTRMVALSLPRHRLKPLSLPRQHPKSQHRRVLRQ
jgi:hypothetical protein